MAIRSRLLGLDDEIIDSMPTVGDSVRDITGTVRSGLGDALAPPTPIDPWADAPGLAVTSPSPTATPANDLETLQRRGGPMNFVHEPIRSTPVLNDPIPLGDTQDDPWAGHPLAGLDVSAQPEQERSQDKGLPGLAGFDPFGTTADESKALERAETRDRRLRIAQGVLRAAGGLGQIFGMDTAGSALGSGISQAASGNYATNVNDVRGQVQQRQAQDMRRMQYGQQQEDRAAEAERRASQDEFRRQELEATVGLRQAQTEQARVRSQQMQDEWSQVSGNRAAAVSWLRSIASQYPNAPVAQGVMRDTEEGGALLGASVEQLDQAARTLATLASSGQVAGRAGIGQAPGGGGGGRPLPDADPVRVANGGLEIPSDVTGPERDIYVDAVNRGLDDPMNAVIAYRGTTPANRQGIWQTAVGRNENRQSGRFVLSEGLNQTEWNTHQTRLDRANAVRDAVRSAAHQINSMIAQHGEIAVRAALNGDNRLANVMGQDLATLRAAIGRATAAYRLEMTGQGSSAAEQNSLLQNLNMGSFASDPNATAQSLRTLGDERLRTAKFQVPPDYVTEWMRRNREAYERSHPQ